MAMLTVACFDIGRLQRMPYLLLGSTLLIKVVPVTRDNTSIGLIERTGVFTSFTSSLSARNLAYRIPVSRPAHYCAAITASGETAKVRC